MKSQFWKGFLRAGSLFHVVKRRLFVVPLSRTQVDKGYLSQLLLVRLWQRDLHLVTGIRRNMKNYLMPLTHPCPCASSLLPGSLHPGTT
ncbi:MAG: hypothetical protein TE42_04920 [Candidatus Synechococcus spongiarum SP3]|uniref:Transposase DDE domain-containing protein n=1 Tax=Candidatus Synechococcus spongiarum SP3 TaxID=1604020 RepID=A0A0G2IWD2_9SYNE|nr:MAG: hypothetical protein TE42_04920 [Candidatus Synechococcus spongiarum SP3]